MLAFCLLAFSSPAASALLCAVPGKDGSGTPSGVINTYYPGTASVSAGATSIPVGSPSGNTSKPIANGDLLLVIQMQDADISYINTSNYGGTAAPAAAIRLSTRPAFTSMLWQAAPYREAPLPLSTGLANSYRSRTANTERTVRAPIQVIRVPQYTSATVSGTVSALPWNGSVGGIVAMDVAGTLTINGTITADGAGFRGGWGESSNTTGPNTDYRTADQYSATA